MAGAGQDELFDPARRWLESCDHYRGTQAFVDMDSGFGGLACGYIERLLCARARARSRRRIAG